MRASASIAGVFPPVVIDGQLHIDGGSFDNLPVGAARRLDAGHVIGCDIVRPVRRSVGFDAVPSAGRVLLGWLLRRRYHRVPGMMATMMQATFLSGVERARCAAADADLFIEAKMSGVRFLDWKALDLAASLGYEQTREALEEPACRERLEAILRCPVEPVSSLLPMPDGMSGPASKNGRRVRDGTGTVPRITLSHLAGSD